MLQRLDAHVPEAGFAQHLDGQFFTPHRPQALAALSEAGAVDRASEADTAWPGPLEPAA